ncbi:MULTISPECIES: C40 family peptidase [unclassified Leptolyngbya]|uniref:C40 family peptidase n=1 Tax=unclassified Leptolyngbya TaxID=2650499 RepID=UPI0016862C69|nr:MULTISPECIES: C40 family peptidase [unclassified Leptolyngbya]MBD1912708.1 C40 family peptidase [Leptolyngbya sp. FACHB-8]MBD2154669.1 C40 family peptidase [Leptolyngbya sp. FACHB-16]
MLSLAQVQAQLSSSTPAQYRCLENLNLYDGPTLERLATQAVAGRQLRIVAQPEDGNPVLTVELCEDDYPGWIAVEDLDLLEAAEASYQAIALPFEEIQRRLPQVIAFTQVAMTQPNHYLWGGTVGPNYDCSGLMQTAFASVGIWLPRDAYQQEAFLQAIAFEDLQPGDLVFFGRPDRCTHVGLYLGDGRYIHSSGKDQGRNGIGVDVLSESGDTVSQAYFRQYRGAGRVVACYGCA